MYKLDNLYTEALLFSEDNNTELMKTDVLTTIVSDILKYEGYEARVTEILLLGKLIPYFLFIEGIIEHPLIPIRMILNNNPKLKTRVIPRTHTVKWVVDKIGLIPLELRLRYPVSEEVLEEFGYVLPSIHKGEFEADIKTQILAASMTLDDREVLLRYSTEEELREKCYRARRGY